MQKREKIIVIITIIAATYGIVDFWLSHHKGDVKISTASETTKELNAKLLAVTSPDNKRLQDLAKQIDKPWKNIFANNIPKKASLKDQSQKDIYDKLSEQVAKIKYTGFLEMAQSKIAIINSNDYQVDDKIDGFTLLQISPVAIKLSKNNFTFTIMAQSLPTAGGL